MYYEWLANYYTEWKIQNTKTQNLKEHLFKFDNKADFWCLGLSVLIIEHTEWKLYTRYSYKNVATILIFRQLPGY